MSRFAALLNVVAIALIAMALVLASAPAAADIDPAFTQFEAPDTTQLIDPCKTPAVVQRMTDLDAAVQRLRIKIDRIEKAKAEKLEAMSATRDPARRRQLMTDYDALNHWAAKWRAYMAKLERQVMYYNSLPPCGGGRRPRRLEWPGEVKPPVALGPFTPVQTDAGCVTKEGADRIGSLTASVKYSADQAEQVRKSIEEDLKALDDLKARGQGESDQARGLKKRIQEKFDNLRRMEEAIEETNQHIRDLQERYKCPPADRQHGAVRLGTCEAGVLAQVNAARADPPAYGASLRGARGPFAAAARDFLARTPPMAALAAEPRLMAAAQAHGADLAARNEVSHRGAGGQGLLDRIRAQGMFVTLAAEVISVKRDTPAAAVRALVIDEGHPTGPHRNDLFNARFTLAGIACVRTRSHGQLVIIDLSNAPMG